MWYLLGPGRYRHLRGPVVSIEMPVVSSRAEPRAASARAVPFSAVSSPEVRVRKGSAPFDRYVTMVAPHSSTSGFLPRGARVLGALLVTAAALGAARPAAAFCRTRTCEFRNDIDCENDLETGCSTVGQFVYWGDNCISYAVQRDGSVQEDISADELDALVDQGFRTWSDVSCGEGRTPPLSVGSQGPIDCDQVEYDCNVPESNSNIVMFRDDFDSSTAGLRFGVIALTTLTANLISGELFDADIEINSRDEDFEIANEGGTGINPDEPRDLRGVINHELGHFLGLSHSEQRGALMRAAYEGTFIPAEDDTEAMCETLGASSTDPECDVEPLGRDAQCVGQDTTCSGARPVTEDDDGCACEVGRPPSEGPGAALGVGLAALACAVRVRRGRRRAH